MEKLKKILVLILLFSFCCCKQNIDKKTIPNDKKQEISNNDSLNLTNIIDKSLTLALKNIDKNNFETEFKTFVNNQKDSISTKIAIDNFFSETQKHLIVETKTQSAVFLNVFVLEKNSFLPVLSHKELNLEFDKYSLLDVNNDEKKDFLILGYASSGCCLKNFATVYLFQKDNSEFSKAFIFINPTFDPKEKIIRGVCYGQRGETEMYKYKWNKKSIDTLEYISFEKDKDGINTGNFIKSVKQNHKKLNSKFIKLNEVPNEYLSIDDYDWFKGDK